MVRLSSEASIKPLPSMSKNLKAALISSSTELVRVMVLLLVAVVLLNRLLVFCWQFCLLARGVGAGY